MFRLAFVLTTVLAVATGLAFTPGCKPKESNEKDEKAEKTSSKASQGKRKRRRGRTPPEGDAPKMGDPVGDAHDEDKVKELPFVEAAEYEKAMLALVGCALDGMKVSIGCPAARNLAKLRRESRLSGDVTSLGVKHLKHADEAVRVHASSLLRSVLASNKEDVVVAALAAAPSEKSPAVLAQLVRVLTPVQQTKKDVGPVLQRLADHASPLVRGEVAAAFASTFAVGVEGTFEKLLMIVEKDASNDVRARACRAMGRRVDDSALPVLSRLTLAKTQAEAPKVYVACWRGLVQMFVSHPFFDRSSEKAFDLFITQLEKTECSNKTPPWEIFNPISEVANPKLAPIAPWLSAKLPTFHKAVARVAACKDAHWIARAAAVDTLKRSKAPPAILASLKAAMKKASGDENAAKMIKKIEAVEMKEKKRKKP